MAAEACRCQCPQHRPVEPESSQAFLYLARTSITIEAKRKGEPTTFMIDGQTKFKGDVQAGAEIIVKYQEQAGGMQKATSVEAKKGSAKHSQ